jgi:alpha-glucosidase
VGLGGCVRSLGPVAVAVLLLCLGVLAADTSAHGQPGRKRWRHAVFYEVYPRSFADSNNDGIGDLNGITAHLDYLKRLGVDAIWITPCFPSPQVDFGYDVSDFKNIDPVYGMMADFDRLVKEARKRGIRIILDFVVNHTSDRHPWFLDSRSSRTAKHRDWYVWRDGRGPGKPPNNWGSVFGGSAWQYDAATGQYYLHQFYPEQPDLNWRNPEVRAAMLDVERFWLERGASGFRLDAVDRMFEDPELGDNPVTRDADGDEELVELHTRNLPELHDVLRDMRTLADRYDAVLIGETKTADVQQLASYYNELQLPMNFLFAELDKLSAPEFRRQIADAERTGEWPVYLFSNHDLPRQWDRYGDGRHNEQIAKLLAALYLTLRGTPILYYGEEIGMQTTDPQRVEDVKDPFGRRFWPENKGRDGERTPMQWNGGANAGFSKAKPWLPVPPSYRQRNVAREEKDPQSILNFYRRVLRLRKNNPALAEGDYVALTEQDPNVLAYLRTYRGRKVLVALNMSAKPQVARIDLHARGLGDHARTLLASGPQPATVNLREVSLAPFSVFIGEVK